MSRSLNKVMIIGNVGGEPDVRATSSGARVAKVSVATNRSWQGKDGQTQEKTEWHRLTFFGRLADIVEQYVKKGDRLYVEGRLEYSQTTDDQGQTRYWTDIVVNEMVMLGSTGGGAGDFGGRSGPSDASAGGFGAGPGAGSSSAPLSEPDDDLPF
jgi:single-strand DNA-binding protein